MAFVAAMSSPDLTTQGVKGSDIYTEAGVGDLRVTFFTKLVRGLSKEDISSNVSKILSKGSAEAVRDLVVMAFQTRDVRGGKGERDLFYTFFIEICKHRPEWSRDLIELVPEYGSWLDIFRIWDLCGENDALKGVLLNCVKGQFEKDLLAERPSLLAKWMPREGSKNHSQALGLAYFLFPNVPLKGGGRMRAYRKAIALLNKKLDTTEIKMAGRTWAAITPGHVPGRLMKKCKLAFFNQKKVRGDVEERYPGNEDRIQCADNFRQLLKDVKEGKVVMKGGHTTMPHEHVASILSSSWYNSSGMSKEEEETIQAQWDAIRAETAKAGGLGKIVPMCDFSGSMDGVPKEVSLALGILVSEVASPAFKDHILTFDSEPQWHSFSECKSLIEKVRSIGSLGVGLSTDFQKAADLVLRKLVENNVAPEDAPTDLLVFTDMGFDAACGNSSYYVTKNKQWQTHFQMIRESFSNYGYQPPRIVCWNLRADYKDYHARANEEGVVQLSGWSPALLKVLTEGGVQVQTPYQGMRKVLDDSRYDRVRVVVDRYIIRDGLSIVRDA